MSTRKPGGSSSKVYKNARHNLKTNQITFADVGGCREAKEAFREIITNIRDKGRYSKLGVRCTKGVLLYGPSGTGKTMLAKAFATEAGIPFLFTSGSEFVELYVGVGSSKVRELFEKARSQKPCVVFIDEIDAVGFRRMGGSSYNGGSREYDTTLNQVPWHNNPVIVAFRNGRTQRQQRDHRHCCH